MGNGYSGKDAVNCESISPRDPYSSQVYASPSRSSTIAPAGDDKKSPLRSILRSSTRTDSASDSTQPESRLVRQRSVVFLDEDVVRKEREEKDNYTAVKHEASSSSSHFPQQHLPIRLPRLNYSYETPLTLPNYHPAPREPRNGLPAKSFNPNDVTDRQLYSLTPELRSKRNMDHQMRQYRTLENGYMGVPEAVTQPLKSAIYCRGLTDSREDVVSQSMTENRPTQIQATRRGVYAPQKGRAPPPPTARPRHPVSVLLRDKGQHPTELPRHGRDSDETRTITPSSSTETLQEQCNQINLGKPSLSTCRTGESPDNFSRPLGNNIERGRGDGESQGDDSASDISFTKSTQADVGIQVTLSSVPQHHFEVQKPIREMLTQPPLSSSDFGKDSLLSLSDGKSGRRSLNSSLKKMGNSISKVFSSMSRASPRGKSRERAPLRNLFEPVNGSFWELSGSSYDLSSAEMTSPTDHMSSSREDSLSELWYDVTKRSHQQLTMSNPLFGQSELEFIQSTLPASYLITDSRQSTPSTSRAKYGHPVRAVHTDSKMKEQKPANS